MIIELFVIKRDGRLEKFSPKKIEEAVKKAFMSVDGEENGQCAAVARQVAVAVAGDMKKSKSVEEIQDIVEAKLMESDRKDVAKTYILYRNERTKVRERNGRLVQKVLDRATSSVDNRSNANVDEKSFSGREKEASADIGKMIALEYGGLSDEVAKAHTEMLVYQHDLEKAVYGVHNCALVNFQELFTYGFHTRNGDVRPPSSFSTACQLMAVAFQCQSQV